MGKNKVVHGYIFKIMYLLCIFLVLFSFLPPTINVYAEEKQYTDVLEDLQKDETFDISAYPVVGNDYSLDVIQIAESADKELFIYTYQPNGAHTASSINISVAVDEKLFYRNYTLTYINSNQTLFKYKVNDFTVRDELTRYYDISSIYRPFDEDIDNELLDDNGNTISEVAYPVARVFIAQTINGQVEYTSTDTEVVEITDKYVGMLSYVQDIAPGVGQGSFSTVENHFVAFNSDHQIDKLISAEVYYQTQSLTSLWGIGLGTNNIFGELQSNHVVVNADERVVVEGDILFSHFTYEWNEIQDIETFLATESREDIYDMGIADVASVTKITDEGLQDLEGMQWVLRFTTTEWSKDVVLTTTETHCTHVTDVSVLMLTFETNGVTYNLGVVDNKTTGDGIPDNTQSISISIKWWVWLILALVILCLLGAFFPVIFTFAWNVIKAVAKGFWYILTAPFEVFNDE